MCLCDDTQVVVGVDEGVGAPSVHPPDGASAPPAGDCPAAGSAR